VKVTKQSSILPWGFLFFRRPQRCVGRQIQVLGSYWIGHMSNEESNSLYKCTVKESCVEKVGYRWYTLSSNGVAGDGRGWTGQPRNRRIHERNQSMLSVSEVWKNKLYLRFT
jgi:hypothetical protein